MAKVVYKRGAKSGAELAPNKLILRGKEKIVKWLINNAKADVNSKNYEGKPLLTVAEDLKNGKVIHLLGRHGTHE